VFVFGGARGVGWQTTKGPGENWLNPPGATPAVGCNASTVCIHKRADTGENKSLRKNSPLRTLRRDTVDRTETIQPSPPAPLRPHLVCRQRLRPKKSHFFGPVNASLPARPQAPAGAQVPPGPRPGSICSAPRKPGFRPTFVGPTKNSFEKGHKTPPGLSPAAGCRTRRWAGSCRARAQRPRTRRSGPATAECRRVGIGYTPALQGPSQRSSGYDLLLAAAHGVLCVRVWVGGGAYAGDHGSCNAAHVGSSSSAASVGRVWVRGWVFSWACLSVAYH
jgi:hypothetical protein